MQKSFHGVPEVGWCCSHEFHSKGWHQHQVLSQVAPGDDNYSSDGDGDGDGDDDGDGDADIGGGSGVGGGVGDCGDDGGIGVVDKPCLSC